MAEEEEIPIVYTSPYRWITTESGETHIWGNGENGDPILLKVRGFHPRCVIRLPENTTRGTKIKKKWTQERAENVLDSIRENLYGEAANEVLTCEYIKWYPLYNAYSVGKKSIMIVQVKTPATLRKIKYMLRNSISTPYGELNLNMYEDDIDHEVKLAEAIDKTNPKRWLGFKARLVPVESKKRHISLDWIQEYSVHYKDIKPIPEWDNKKASSRYGFFDIETYSSKKSSSGKRPMPDHRLDNDVITMICTLVCQSGSSYNKGVAIVLGDCYEPEEIPGYAEIEIICVKTEKELIYKWFDIINREKILRFSGYNIDGYDFDYVARRLQYIISVESEYQDSCMRLVDNKYPIWKGISLLKKGEAYVKPTPNSKNGGYVFMADGRISIDVINLIRKAYKFPDYKLDTVGEKLVGLKKHPVSPEYMFVTHEDMQSSAAKHASHRCKGDNKKTPSANKDNCRICRSYHEAKVRLTKVVEYCLQDCMIPKKIFDRILIEDNIEASSAVNKVDMFTICNRGELKKFTAQLYYKCREHNHFMDMRPKTEHKYDGGYVWDPTRGVWVAIVLDFSSMYPNIIITNHLCYSTLVPNVLVPSAKEEGRDLNYIRTEANHKDKKGNIVKTDYYDNYFLMDTPTSIVPEILNKLLMTRRHINKVIIAGIDLEYKPLIDKQKTYDMLCKIFEGKVDAETIRKKKETAEIEDDVKGEYYKLLAAYPNLDGYREVLDEYAASAEERKNRIAILKAARTAEDVRQLQTKVSANAGYGATGAQSVFAYSCIEIASSVTTCGRNDINQVADCLTIEFPDIQTQIIYGDTDSVFITNTIISLDYSKCYYWGITYQQSISGYKIGDEDGNKQKHTTNRKGILKGTMGIEYEKGMFVVNYDPKNYVGYFITRQGKIKMDNIVDTDGNIIGRKEYLHLRGVPPARRDHTAFENNLLLRLYKLTLDAKVKCHNWIDTFDKTMTIIIEYCKEFVAGQIPLVQFSSVKTVGSKDDYFVRKFANKLIAEGHHIDAKDRLHYVVVKSEHDNRATKVGDKMMLLEAAEEEGAEIDTVHYFGKIQAQVEKHFNVVFPNEIAAMGSFGYNPLRSPVTYGLNRVVTLLTKYYIDGGDFDDFLRLFHKQLYAKARIKRSKKIIFLNED